jgi:hypothetical protein
MTLRHDTLVSPRQTSAAGDPATTLGFNVGLSEGRRSGLGVTP